MAGTRGDDDTGAFEFEKVSIADARKAIEDGGPTGHASAPRKDGDWDAKRRGAASEPLSPETVAWLARLPATVRPNQLALRYARIANRICETWKAPLHCLRLLDGLITDDRGGRQGFPLHVATELANLRDHYYKQHRKGDQAWEHVEMGR
ncbi:MAG: hypothetical protein JSS46_01840 [Proteobacteria bacterium]|nr:hypothetical protein [Pseudomonadota bacterium]